MRRASPRVRVAALDKAAVAAVEVPGVDFTEADAISLSTTGVSIEGGFATPLNAVLPDKHLYQRLRFSFTPPVLGAADNEVTLVLWERTPDGELIEAGRSVLDATDLLPAIEVDNHDARYYLGVEAISGAAAKAVTTKVFVQGLYAPTYVAVD